ncbi:MAG: hypothetical protein ACRD0J_03120 [Acidimicrobiales bacterium]
MADGLLRFHLEWYPTGGEVRAPELAATWARLDIEVGDRHPTIVEDVGSGAIRRSIVVSAFPLAEWVTYHWWALLYDGGKDARTQLAETASERIETAESNSLRSVGDGFAWPDLSVRRDGDAMQLRWSADREPHRGWPVRFLTSGTAWLGEDELRRALSDLVEATLTRLEESGLTATTLHKEWQALRDLDEDEVDFCQACGRLGVDPFAEDAELADVIATVYERLGSATGSDLLDAVGPNDLGPSLEWIGRAQVFVSRSADPGISARWLALQKVDLATHQPTSIAPASSRSPRIFPYQVGYQRAALVRRSLDRPATEPFRLEELPIVPLADGDSPTTAVQALSIVSPERSYARLVLGWKPSPASELFVAARSLWSLWFDQGSVALLTGASSWRQQVSRAFAAELLAPAEGIQELLGGRPATAWGPAIADHFGVSDLVIEHQVDNQLRS